MPKSHRRSKVKESKTDKLNRVAQEYKNIQEKLDETNRTVVSLETQYQADATNRHAYQKSTYQKLSAAYKTQGALSAELQQKQAEYDRIEAEPESSSSDESEKRTSGSSVGRVSSSGSSAPATIGWDCGTCEANNFTDPWGPDNICTCGHRFCDEDTHCTAQWNP
ncbi:hypothetical protein NKR23_g12260 [Pleurostoma richardsiae]|uniref:Uncharacterized protein n=1 Tax=Pleurostoma richardsiae TaxID=41990 RepID=A0AA38VG92_9PEZI|nr:hypothetical protein NKR23_g12260 [Pleurostoma richardsiae]